MARVNFVLNKKDFRAVLLGSMGFSNDYIQRETGLSIGQVQYRLRKAKVRLGDYRDGTNPAARQVLITAQDQVGTKLKTDLEKLEEAISGTIKKAKAKKRTGSKTRKVA